MVVRWFSQNVLQRVSLYSRRSYIYYLARPRYLLLIEIKTKEWRERQRIMPGAHCPARLSPRPLITAANECDIELATLRLIKLNTLVFAAAVRFNHQIFTCGVEVWFAVLLSDPSPTVGVSPPPHRPGSLRRTTLSETSKCAQINK